MNIINFPHGPRLPSPGEALVDALRRKVVAAGGSWDRTSDEKLRRVLEIMDEAMPLKVRHDGQA